MIEIRMPRLSDTMEEGTITAWVATVGSTVTAGDVLVEIETDKAVMEQEAFESGTLTHVLVPAGGTARIGEVIAVLDGPEGYGGTTTLDAAEGPEGPEALGRPEELGEADAPDSADLRTDGAQAAAPDHGEAPRAPDESATGDRRLTSSPLVRRLAREHGVDLTSVRGTGPGGRIVRRDLEAALADGTATPSPSTLASGATPASTSTGTGTGTVSPAASSTSLRGSVEHPTTAIQRVSADRLTQSTATVPQFSVTATADVTDLVEMRTTLCAALVDAGRAKVSMNDLVVRASALALRAHPEVNASYESGSAGPVLLRHARVNVGVAVATEHGLMVPVVHDADTLPVSGVHDAVASLAAAAHARRLTTEQMQGGTFTVSNLGMLGVEHFRAIVNPPEAAILAVGAVRREPVVRARAAAGTTAAQGTVAEEIVVRARLTLTVSVDHRAVDGATAATFLQTLVGLLEHPWAVLA